MAVKFKDNAQNKDVEQPREAPSVETIKEKKDNAIRVPTLLDLANTANKVSQLDIAGKNYVDEIVANLRTIGYNVVARPVSTNSIEARLIIDEGTKLAFCLLFEETYTHIRRDTMPPIIMQNEINALVKDATIVQAIVVTRDDYSRGGRMSSFIANSFATINGPANDITVENMRDMQVGVVTDLAMVNAFIDKHSPHAVPARADIGILITLKKHSNNFNEQGEDQPIMAITGYTKFVSPEQGNALSNANGKFIPIPTITDIVTSIPNKRLMAMALPLAAQQFIVNRQWVQPYSSFSKDKNKPNLGNLIQDPQTKGPAFVSDPMQMNDLIGRVMAPPFFGIDISDGRARIVGLQQFGDDQMINTCLRDIYSFYTKADVNFNGAVKARLKNYNGTYVEKSEIKDTRCVDYLSLVNHVSDFHSVVNYLQQHPLPETRYLRVREMFPKDSKCLYETISVILNSEFVTALNQLLVKSIPNIRTCDNSDLNVNMAGILSSGGNDYTGMAYGNVSSGLNSGFTTRYTI